MSIRRYFFALALSASAACSGDVSNTSTEDDPDDLAYDEGDLGESAAAAKAPRSTTAPPSRVAKPLSGVWLSKDEVAKMKIDGEFATPWAGVVSAAKNGLQNATLADQYGPTNVYALAKALVVAKTGNTQYRKEVQDALVALMGTEDDSGARALSVGRKLAAWVIAADLIGGLDGKEGTFRTWLRSMLTKKIDGESISENHERSASNWGTNTGATRAAIAAYLEDEAELARVAKVFKGYLGSSEPNTGSWTSFTFHDTSWQEPGAPLRGINHKGATKNGHSIDGVLTEDMRRGSSFTWPPTYTNYPWAGLQGAVVQAEILFHKGFADVWAWEDSALLRATAFLDGLAKDPEVDNPDWWAHGDDEWQPYLVNFRTSKAFPTRKGTSKKYVRWGKNMGFTDWTHGPGQLRDTPN